QREQPGQVRVAGLLEIGDQQGPPVVPDARLDAAQYLVVEQQAHALDVVLLPWRLAFHADQADHVLAAPGQALRGAVGDVAELLDDLEHARPGAVPHPVLAVHDPGDRRGRDTGQPRDVVERNHRGSPHWSRILSGYILGSKRLHREI